MNGYITNLHWYSDWNGDEVGYDDVLIVGLYRSERLSCDFYIDTENGEILEVIPDMDEEVGASD